VDDVVTNGAAYSLHENTARADGFATRAPWQKVARNELLRLNHPDLVARLAASSARGTGIQFIIYLTHRHRDALEQYPPTFILENLHGADRRPSAAREGSGACHHCHALDARGRRALAHPSTGTMRGLSLRTCNGSTRDPLQQGTFGPVTAPAVEPLKQAAEDESSLRQI